MDLKVLDENASKLEKLIEFKPKDKKGNEYGSIWKVHSYKSNAFKKKATEMKQLGLDRVKDTKIKPKAEEVERYEIEAYAVLVSSWEGMKENGKELECTFENVCRVLGHKAVGTEIRNQLNQVAEDDELFIKAS